jgi:hypothetical protein
MITVLLSFRLKSASDPYQPSAHELIIGERLAESWTKAALNSDQLTDQDLMVVNSFLSHEWLHNARMQRVARAGFDQVEFGNSAGKWVSYLGNETALRWWKAKQTGSFLISNPELQDEINRLLRALGPEQATSQKRLLDSLRKSPTD